MHTICTHTIHRYKIHTRYTSTIQNTEYREQRTETNTQTHIQENTENNAQPQRTDTTQSCTHSFDFYHLQQYIKKLYNIAIYEFYTFCSPYL